MNAMNGKNRETPSEEKNHGARIRWGILGTGKIAGKFASELKRMEASQGSIAHAVASRDPERARNFAREHGIPHACGGYDELLTQPVVNSYPEDAAKLFFEELRLALREGRVQPSFARGA